MAGLKYPMQNKTALICGGSKGIGKETAKQIARLGGSVTIVARDEKALMAAKEEILAQASFDGQYVDTISCDTTDYDKLQPLLANQVDQRGVPDYLINAVGYAYPQYAEKITFEEYKRNMDVNYLGQLVPTIIMQPYFIEAQRGHISFVSSVMGFMAIMGYASYAPSKYALVGLAETLRHELKPYNISVSLLYPPDTDTPGFEHENKSKPPETAKLSESGKLYTPEQVAKIYVDNLLKGKFHILIGEGKLFWIASRWFPRLVHAIIDSDYKKIRKELGKQS